MGFRTKREPYRAMHNFTEFAGDGSIQKLLTSLECMSRQGQDCGLAVASWPAVASGFEECRFKKQGGF